MCTYYCMWLELRGQLVRFSSSHISYESQELSLDINLGRKYPYPLSQLIGSTTFFMLWGLLRSIWSWKPKIGILWAEMVVEKRSWTVKPEDLDIDFKSSRSATHSLCHLGWVPSTVRTLIPFWDIALDSLFPLLQSALIPQSSDFFLLLFNCVFGSEAAAVWQGQLRCMLHESR